MEYGGDNLNRYQNSQLLDGASAKELHQKLLSIRGIFSIVAIYAAGSNHYAIINFARPIKGDLNEVISEELKKSRPKKTIEQKNN
jgi:hypothetical protein